MTTTKRIAIHLLAVGMVGALAMPALAQGFNPAKLIKQSLKDAKAAADQAAANAAAKARATADAATAAERLAADTRAGKIAPPKGIGDKFNPLTMKQYVDALNTILADLKNTTTAAQATAYAPKFKTLLASVDSGRQAALGAYADAIRSGVKTADNDAAEKLLTSAGATADAIEKEMPRVQKLNPALAADFKKFSDLHDQE